MHASICVETQGDETIRTNTITAFRKKKAIFTGEKRLYLDGMKEEDAVCKMDLGQEARSF